MTDKKYLLWGDVTRVLAMIMVLFLHAAAPYVDRYAQVPASRWDYANFFHSITRASVPLFFMLSGMLLLRTTREATLTFYRKRLARILPPLLFWSVVYLAWGNYHHGLEYNIISGLQAILAGDVRFHLWFIYVLIGLYLITPLLRMMIDRLDHSLIYALVILWFGLVSLVPFLEQLTPLEAPWQTSLLVFDYLGYYLLGHLLANSQLSSKRSWLFWFLVWCVSVAATAYLTASVSFEKGGLTILFYHYTSVNVVLMTVALFLMLKSLPYDRIFDWFPRLKTVTLQLSGISYGMYIGHVLVQEILWENWPDKIGYHPLLVIPLIVVSVGVITSCVLLATDRVPVFRRLVN
jgi:surface polysaccharide O-acyltransferase-like enzyme